MKIESQFHCDINLNFYNKKQMVRGFIYENYFIEPHCHDFYEINIIMSGSGTHLIEGNHFIATKGDVFVIPPNITHAYTNTHKMDVYHILIKPQFVDHGLKDNNDVKGFNLFMQIEPFLREHYDKSLFLHLSASDFAYIQSDLELIKDNNHDIIANNCDPLKNHTVIKLIYFMSLLLHSQLYNSKENSKVSDQDILKVLDFIHENYAEKISIDTLCHYANISRATLMRKFKAVCQCTPMSYLMHYRSLQADKLMNEGSLSKTQIAYECGFYDLSHMEKHLR